MAQPKEEFWVGLLMPPAKNSKNFRKNICACNTFHYTLFSAQIANYFYLAGSLCFLIGTLINMLAR